MQGTFSLYVKSAEKMDKIYNFKKEAAQAIIRWK